MHRKIVLLALILPLSGCYEDFFGSGKMDHTSYIEVSNCTNDSVGITAIYSNGNETHYTHANTSGRSSFQYYFSSKEGYDDAIGKIKFDTPYIFNGDTLDQEKDFNFSCHSNYGLIMVYGDINNCRDKSWLLDTNECKAFKPLK